MPYLTYAPETPEELIYELKLGINTIGRSSDNTIVIPDREQSVSRQHAEIIVTKISATIKDLTSANGTFVNNIRINEKQINYGELIILGSAKFKFTETITPQKSESKDSKKSIIEHFPLKNSANDFQNVFILKKSTDHSVIKLQEHNSERRRIDKLKILLEVTTQLCSPEEPDKLLNKILSLLFKIMDIDRAVILIVNEDSGELESKAFKLKENTPIETQFYSTHITNLVRESGNGILTRDATSDFNDANSVIAQSIHASMCVPLKPPHNEVLGVLYVDNLSMKAAYSREDMKFLTALANQAAVAIHMAREFYKREQALKKEVKELKIEIDEMKINRDVSEIIHSDWFDPIVRKARKWQAKRKKK